MKSRKLRCNLIWNEWNVYRRIDVHDRERKSISLLLPLLFTEEGRGKSQREGFSTRKDETERKRRKGRERERDRNRSGMKEGMKERKDYGKGKARRDEKMPEKKKERKKVKWVAWKRELGMKSNEEESRTRKSGRKRSAEERRLFPFILRERERGRGRESSLLSDC